MPDLSCRRGGAHRLRGCSPLRRVQSASILALAAAATGPSWAQPATTEQVVVTATRTETRAFDIPASIDSISGDEVRDGRAQVNISESLAGVPGLLARDRQNYAQDVQISVRGFGARASFGVRGVRLYVDGIPATLPDGQGQISNVDLGSVGRIEVLRGPFSALYGNSAGGVVQVFTLDGVGPPQLAASVAAGSDGALRFGLQASGASGGAASGSSAGSLGYVLSASRFRTDGWRDHSATTRNLGNVKLTWRPDAEHRVTLVANSLALSRAQDPLGLTRAQFEADPRSVDPAAKTFDTRKTVEQTQAGVVVERRFGAEHTLQLTAYGGHRSNDQFQSIPVATQQSPLHPGGVIVLDRRYHGADLRWTWKARFGELPYSVVAGLTYDRLAEQRQGYQNFAGTALGVLGALRRNEDNDVTSTDPYVQTAWQLTPQWSVHAGVRSSRIRFESTDAYVVGINPNDSGSASYRATLPVAGVMFAASDEVHVYATAGRGFETPTLNELSYRGSGGTGLNFDLRSARSNSVEVGVKTRFAGLGEISTAVFRTGTEQEIVTQSNVGGRATFQNAGATRRSGFELSWSQRWLSSLRAQVALTTLSAVYRDGFATCAALPCATPTLLIPAGNRIPGLAKESLYASLGWLPVNGFRGAFEVRGLSRVWVNDANSDAAAGHAVAAAHVGYAATTGPVQWSSFVRVDNLFDRAVIGSVIVNEGNRRFFEPAPGRTWLASVSASVAF